MLSNAVIIISKTCMFQVQQYILEAKNIESLPCPTPKSNIYFAACFHMSITK
jgi:hypothetical protein